MMMHCVGPKGNFHCVIQNGIVLACEIISHHLCHLFVRQIWYLLYLEQEVEAQIIPFQFGSPFATNKCNDFFVKRHDK